MIAITGDHRAAYGIEPIWKVMPNALSTYHDHAAKRVDPRKLSQRAQREIALKPKIARVFAKKLRGGWRA